MQTPSSCKRGGTRDLSHQGLLSTGRSTFAGRALPDRPARRQQRPRQPRCVTWAAQSHAHSTRLDTHPHHAGQHQLGRQQCHRAHGDPRSRQLRRCRAVNNPSSSAGAASNGSTPPVPDSTAAASLGEPEQQAPHEQDGAGEVSRPPPKVPLLTLVHRKWLP